MPRRIIAICFALCCFLCSYAQKQPKPYVTGSAYFDSLKNQKPSIKPTGDFDQRFSFINGNNYDVNIWGYRVGLLVNDRYKVGIGAYTFTANIDSSISKLKKRTNISQLNQSLYYGTVYFEPYLIRRRRWEMSLVMEMGYGQAKLGYTDIQIDTITGTRTRVTDKSYSTTESFVPIGMGLSFNLIIPDKKGWHFLTYFGLNAIVGMRTVILESSLKQNYDGFFYSLGTAIYIDRIFTDISGKRKRTMQANKPIN